jgi:serine/threonine-protein kinase
MYMSPEQIQDGTVDLRSDLYSLGVTIYHMLAGRPPFTGDTQLALAMMHTQAEVPDIREFRADTPESLCDLVSRLLQKSPDDRFATPAEVLDFLKENRNVDLADVWPEQTIPLPRASLEGDPGTIQATQALRAMLKKRKSSTRSPWIFRIAGALISLGTFGLGIYLTFNDPFESDKPSEEFLRVPRMEDAAKQYAWALVNTDLRAREDKWRAVEHFFPPTGEDRDFNRGYADQANLQLARALHRKGDSDQAKERLDRTINSSQSDNFVRAHANILKALIIDEKLEEDADASEIFDLVNAASSILQDEVGQKEELQSQLDSLIPPERRRTYQAWFGSPN